MYVIVNKEKKNVQSVIGPFESYDDAEWYRAEIIEPTWWPDLTNTGKFSNTYPIVKVMKNYEQETKKSS